MASALSVAGVGLVSILAAVAIGRTTHVQNPPTGHLILQIEGDATALRVTRVTPKPDPYGRNEVHSPYQIVVRAQDRSEIGRYPLDLSMFDMDPAHVGNPPRVEGDRFIDTRVAALVNIPRFPNAASLTIVFGDRTLGQLDPATYGTLLTEGDNR